MISVSLLKRLVTTMLLLSMVCALFASFVSVTHSAPNYQINYQGKLTNASNVAVADGVYNMRFWLLTSAVTPTTSAVWTEELTGTNRVQVTNGLFSVMLGSTTPLTGVDFNQVLYLGVEIGGTSTPAWDGEMSPRKTLGAVPAAFEADRLDGLTSSQFARTDATTSIATSSASTLFTITQSGTGNIFDVFDGAQNVFTIRDGGFIGIGTTTPSRLLTIQGGDAWIGGNLTATGTLTISGLATLPYASTTGISGTNLTFTNGIISFASTTGLTATNANLTNLTIGGDTITDFVGSGLALSGSTLTATGDGVSNWLTLNGALTPSSTLGLRINASSTIGDGTGAGGLTIYGNSTTTGDAYFTSSIGIGTTTPSATLSIAGTGLTNPFLIASSTGSALLTLNTRGTLVFGTTTNANIFLNGGPTTTAINSLFRRNIALGHDTLAYIDTTVSVIDNIAIGFEALRGSPSVPMTGGSNLAFGYQALKLNTAGSYNNALGIDALSSNTTGSNNNALSTEALVLNTTGSNNNALGQFALYSNTSGSKNNALGDLAGFTNTIGNANTFLGALTNALSNNLSTSTAIGAGAIVGCSNCMVLGGTGVNYVNVGIGTTTPSRLLTIQGGDAWIGGNLTATGTATFLGMNTTYASTTALTLSGSLYDGSQSAGTNGMVLQTTGSGVQWVATSSLGFSSTGDGVSNWLTLNGALTPSSTLGLRINASSTIGDGTGAGGLTIYGNSTTTGNAYFGGRLSLGSTSPSAILSIDAGSDNTADLISVGSSTAGVATSSTYFRIASTGRSYLTGAAVDPVFIAEEQGDTPGTTLDGANDIAIVGDYAYVITNNQYSLVILDISNPADPVVVSELRDTGLFQDVTAIEISGSYAYLVNYTRASLSVVDISDPKNPRFVAEEQGPVPGTTLSGVYDVKISGSFAYMVSELNESIIAIDISNPLDPIFASAKVDASVFNTPESLAIQGKYAYVTNVDGDSLTIVDISNPYNLAIAGTITDTLLDGAYGVSISGRYAYIGSSIADAFVIVDISNPTSPTIVGSTTHATLFNGAKHIALAGNLAYVAAGVNNSVTVVDVSSSTNPRIVAVEYGPTQGTSLGGILGIAVQGNYLYTTNYARDSIAVLDIGGADISTFAAGAGQIDTLAVLNDAQFGQNLFVGGGLSVGSRGFSSGGISSVTALATTSLAQTPAFSVFAGDNNTASVIDVFSLTHMVTSTSTPAQNGLGAGLLFNNETDFGLATSTSRIASIFTNVSSTSPQSALTFSNKNTAGALTEFMRLNHTGNLGLGTTSPSAKLTISQGIGGTGNLFQIASSSNGTATSTYMIVTQAGRVGIGTTTPSQLLDIASGSTHAGIALTAATTSNPFIHFKEGTSVRGDVYYDSSANTFQMRALESGSDLILKAGGDVERMRITSTGLLGIGTTTPSRLLTIQGGDAWIGGNLTATGTLTISGLATLPYASTTGISGTNLTFTNGIISFASTTGLTATNANLTNLTIGGDTITDFVGSGLALSGSTLTATGDGVSNWLTLNGALTPSSTLGLRINASSTIGDGTGAGGLTIYGNSTTTGDVLVGGGARVDGQMGIGVTALSGAYGLEIDDPVPMYLRDGVSAQFIYTTTGGGGRVMIGAGVAPANFLSVSGGTSIGANYNVTAPSQGLLIEGNTGIGTTSPVARLSVTGTSSIDPFNISSTTGATLLRVTSAGNLGIGTTTPSRLLTIQGGDAWIGGNLTATGTLTISGLATLPYASTTGISGTNLTFTNGIISFASTTGISGENLAFTNGEFTYATSTYLYSPTVSSTQMYSGTFRAGVSGSTLSPAFTFAGNTTSGLAWDAGSAGPVLVRSGVSALRVAGSAITYIQGGNYDAGQLVVGSTTVNNNAGGKIEFTRHVDGSSTAWIGRENATGNSLGLMNESAATGANIFFGTNLREHMTIDVAGNIGIGSTSPSAKLTVTQGIGGSGHLFQVASSSDGLATSTIFAILSNGNVGIGTTSASMLEPLSRILAVSADNSDTVRIKLNNTTGQWELRQNSGSHQFTIDDNKNNRIGLNITNTGDIHLAPEAGNVGIGTTTPGSRLTVAGGDAWIGGNLTATGTATFANLVTTNATTSGIAYFGSRVGIGANNPTTTLAVQGDGSINPFFVSAFAGDSSLLVDTLGRVSIGTTTSQGGLLTLYSSSTDAVLSLRSDDDNNDPNQNPFIEFIEGAVEKGHIGTTGSTGFAFDSTLIGSTHDMFAVHGVDGLYLATAGRVWSALTADGNFGIGDTNPTTAKLSIIQNMNNGTDDLFRIASSSNGTATSTRFLIDAYGRVGVGGTTTLTSLLALDNRSLTGSVVGGIKEYLSFINSTENATYYGDEMYITNSPTATSTLVGSIIRVEDTSALGNTVSGLEVQTDRGTNALGLNTAISGFGRTFGVRGTTVGNAGQLALPAGVFAETEGTTQGNALRAYSGSITTETLVSFFQDASTFSGTGLEMNFGNNGGSFAAGSSAKFLDFQIAGTSKFTVTAGGTTTIGDGTTGTMAGLQIGFGGLCVDTDGACTASTSGRITSVSSALGNSDLAEVYFSDDELRTGEIVALAGGLSIARADEANARDVIGVVSTKPGLLLGHDDTSLKSGETGYPVGLSGRVPVILSTENGPIAKGDRITLSSIPGVGMKATESSRVVGVAMEDFDGESAYSEGFLNQFGDDLVRERTTARRENYDPRTQDGCYYGSGVSRGEACESSEVTPEEEEEEDYDPAREREEILAEYRNQDADDESLPNGDTVAVGQALMFIELTNYASDRERMVLSALTATSTLDGSDETLWDRITALAQNFVAGVLSVLELKADKVQVQQELCVEDVCVTADDLRMLLQNAQNQGGGGAQIPEPSTPPVPSETDGGSDVSSGDATGNDTSENLESLGNTSDSGYEGGVPDEVSDGEVGGISEGATPVAPDESLTGTLTEDGASESDGVEDTAEDTAPESAQGIPQVGTDTDVPPSILEDNAPQI